MSTIVANTNFTLNGVSNFTVGSDTYQWSNNWLGFVEAFAPNVGQNLTATVTLAGTGWGMSTLRFAGPANLKVVVSDAAGVANRNIENLILIGLGGSKVTLSYTGIDYLRGGSGIDDITLGAGNCDAVSTHDGNDIVRARAGWVNSIDTGNGNDKVTVGAGGAGHIGTGNENDTVVLGSGGVEAVATGSGNDTVIGGTSWLGVLETNAGNDVIHVGSAQIDLIRASDGNNTITVGNGGKVQAIVAFQGIDKVTLSGTGAVDSIAVGDGANTVVGASGWIGSILAFGGNDTVRIGAGGADMVRLGHGNNSVTTSTEWVTSIAAYSGNDIVSIGSGGAGSVYLGQGANSFTSSSGWVGSVLAFDGNDTVRLGTGGGGAISLFGGTDTVTLSRITDPGTLVQINGGSGTDSISFAAFAQNLNISLASADVQDTGTGMFVLTGFERLTTGIGKNTLVGNGAANVLNSGAGDDVLIGAFGKDIMIGGSGGDVFHFLAPSDSAINAGADVILDFDDVGNDRIDVSALFRSTMTYLHDDAFTAAGQVRVQAAGTAVVVEINTAGTGGAESEITLANTTLASMAASDFIL